MLESPSRERVDRVEWPDEPGVLAAPFPAGQGRIAPEARIRVAPTQRLLVFEEGALVDILAPGTHRPGPAAMPGLARLRGWDDLPPAPFEADLCFVSIEERIGMRWVTPQPLLVDDKDRGRVPVAVAGNYAFRVASLPRFAETFLSGRRDLSIEAIAPVLDAALMAGVERTLGVPGLALAALTVDPGALAGRLQAAADAMFEAMGLCCTELGVDTVALPAEEAAPAD